MKKTVYFLLLLIVTFLTILSCNEDDSSQLHKNEKFWQQEQITFNEFLKSEGNKPEIKKIKKYFQGDFSDISNKGKGIDTWEIDTTTINKIVTPEITTYTFGVLEYEPIEGFRNVIIEVSGNNTKAMMVSYPEGIDFNNHSSKNVTAEEIENEIWGKGQDIACYKVVIILVYGCSSGECSYGWELVEIPCPTGGSSDGGDNGSGSGGNGNNTGTPTDPVPGGHDPVGWDGGGGNSSPYDQLADELDAILGPDDYFSVGVTIPNNSPTFTSVDQFEIYLNSFIDQVESKTVLNENGETRTLKTRIKRTPFSGIDILTKIEKNNNIYSLTDVSSHEWGVTLGYDWEQESYNQTIQSNIITINVIGYENYSIFINGIGTVYSKQKTIQVKVNASTGLLL